ncbi:MAG: RHS repeat-associated core domain-containing protein [Bacteroidia bacterium]
MESNHGYVVGWAGTIRRTDDGGNTWQVVLPEINSSGVPDYKTVWTTSTGNAIIGGTGGFVGSAGPSNTVTNAGTGYAYNSSNTQTWYKARFNANYSSLGYMVGSNNGVLTLTVNSGALATSGVAPLSTAIPAPGSAGTGTFPVSNLHSLHVFRDNSFMVVGSSGAIYYYNAVASSQWNDESPTAVASYGTYTWMDIDARDDRTMWVAGNSSSIGGSIIKVIDPVNIQPNIPLTYSVTPIGSAWALEPIADGPTANNIVTNANQVTINAIAFSGPYNGFVGGSYSGTPPSNTGGYPYARLLTDEGGQFSQLNYYDIIGHLVLTQTTKQHNFAKQAYSYVIYDALGRNIESGQKTENADTAHIFNKIFGDTILGFYNPNVLNPTKYLAWIKDSTGVRTQVTHDYYDVQDILPVNILAQQNLRNRIASVVYADTLKKDSIQYNNGIHYSYDVHGNQSSVVQDDSIPGISGQRYKKTDYQFDIVSGDINEIDYQSGEADQYHQKYSFDADNRITQVETSKDSIMWDCDAKYLFYAHSPIAREEIGDQQVQGMDYAATLKGWQKGVNSDLLDSNRDMGHDGLEVPGNLNRYFARDAMGYSLKYFTGDYDAINKNVWNNNVSRFEAQYYNSDLMKSRHDLLNGNISAMVTNIQQPQKYSTTSQSPITLPQGMAYNYDQLNRVVDSKAFQNIDTNNIWGLGTTYTGLYHNWLTYDANGNIMTQKRADQNGNIFDSLTYRYNMQGGRTMQNRLYHVNDAVSGTVDGITDDIRDEGTFDTTESTMNQANNYEYNSSGELAKDKYNQIDSIIWTQAGMVKSVVRTNGSTKKNITFDYDGLNNRIAKHVYTSAGVWLYDDYYVRGFKHDILAIYHKQNNSITSTMNYLLTERDIYGRNRIGTENTNVEMIGAIPSSQIDTMSRYLGFKHYELGSEIGNVLSVVSDRKIPRPNSALTSIDHYEADVISSNDYYPFGMLQPARTFNASKYRYGFNKMEKDNEVYGVGNEYNYETRIFDPRLGRFLSTDSKKRQFPNLSVYQFASNSPIDGIDQDGRETKWLSQYFGATQISAATVKGGAGLGAALQYEYATGTAKDAIGETQFTASTFLRYTNQNLDEGSQKPNLVLGAEASVNIEYTFIKKPTFREATEDWGVSVPGSVDAKLGIGFGAGASSHGFSVSMGFGAGAEVETGKLDVDRSISVTYEEADKLNNNAGQADGTPTWSFNNAHMIDAKGVATTDNPTQYEATISTTNANGATVETKVYANAVPEYDKDLKVTGYHAGAHWESKDYSKKADETEANEKK